jgi:hypothetical protein
MVLVSLRFASESHLFILRLFPARRLRPTIFGSLQDLLDCELQYEASNDYLEDQAHWTKNLSSGSGQRHRPPEAPGGGDPHRSSEPGPVGSCGPAPSSAAVPGLEPRPFQT